ncbi:ABC transporter substrate-binding protein [Brachybacterium saurashtrense]|uniref:ABC transporter substrate-binding protein n=1 Tax=Brachybacterium saurashtrense TaxID=556288 RepID=A0A345YMW2_9MICO|nr:ABC transporter substrate-binding protein [Brachybacterium saurashtrense]AXK45264.1 ABC transporter substrate-binding protein [Brachybacterium saurashtrense]RRR21981.1 ABC transporter substrate-binding protein [Brachybacterium saurashtrense]
MTTALRRRTLLGSLAALPALGLAACGEVTVEGEENASEQLTIVDDQEREVVLPGPAATAVVLNSYTNEFLRAIGAADRVVGVDRASLDRLPYLDLGEDQIIAEGLDQLNYEAIAELAPDVVIMPRNAVWQEAAEQLEAFGIPLVVATAWDTDVVDETLTLLGQVFGLEDGAQTVLDFREEISTALTDRLADVEPVSVYFETVEPYLTTLPGSGFHAMILAAGGANVFDDASGGDAQEELTVDPAEVVLRDPEFVIHEFEPSAAPVDRFEELREDIASRPGWDGMTALAEGHVAIANGWATSALGKSLGALYLASWLHPEQMADVDPDEYLTRWVTEFQATELSSPSDYVQGPEA